jgi:type II secretory pathway component PulF
VTTSFAGILDQLGGELSWLTKLIISLADLIRFGPLLIPLVLFVAFLIFKEIEWKSKVRTLVFNNVVFLVTLTLGFSLRVALNQSIMGIVQALSE